jgi:hypothetical protein
LPCPRPCSCGSKPVFWLVLAVGCGAVAAVYLLVRLSPEKTP